MRPQVRDLYKRFLIVGVDYPHPEGLSYVRRKVKSAFEANRELTHEADINKAVARGRRVCNDIVEFIQFKKYRAMRQRYSLKDEDKARAAEAYREH